MNCTKCRAPLPPGSRFCNGCGMPVMPPNPSQPGAAPPAAPTQGRPGNLPGAPAGASQAPSGQAPYSGQYRQQPPASMMPLPGAVPDGAPPKKPVGLLIGAVAVLVGAVALGSIALTHGGHGSVVGTKTAQIPEGPGVQMAQTPDLPQGPAVTAGHGGVPPMGAPVAGARKKDDGMAPPLTMSNGQAPPPGAGVISAQSQPPVPGMPSTAAPWTAPQKGAPMTAAPAAAPTPSAPVVAARPPAQPQPRDNRDLDSYLQWLRFVETQRELLRGQYMVKMTTLGAAPIEAMLGAIDDPSADPQAMLNQRMNGEARQIAGAMIAFHRSILQSRNQRGFVVPADCRELDRLYMAAVDQESAMVGPALQCVMFAGNNPSRAMAQLSMIKQQAKTGIYPRLRAANAQLQAVYKARDYDIGSQVTIDSTSLDGGGGLGGLGLPGL